MKKNQSKILDAILNYLYLQVNPIQLGILTKDLTSLIDADKEDIENLVKKLNNEGYIDLENTTLDRKSVLKNDKGIDFLKNDGGYTKLFKKQVFNNFKEVLQFLQILKPSISL